jgi:hypothetical protein
VYIPAVGQSCTISVCYTAAKENEKGFSEGNGLDGWNEIGDLVSRYTGRKLEKLVLIAQHELVEQPGKPLAVTNFQRFYGAIDDALLQAFREKSPMIFDREST